MKISKKDDPKTNTPKTKPNASPTKITNGAMSIKPTSSIHPPSSPNVEGAGNATQMKDKFGGPKEERHCVLTFMVKYYDDETAEIRLVENIVEANHFSIAIALNKILGKLLSSMYEMTQEKNGENIPERAKTQ